MITQKLRKINYHYANYASLRKYITQILRKYITQIITHITQSLRKYITQIILRYSRKYHYADYANTFFITHHYAMGNLLMVCQ